MAANGNPTMKEGVNGASDSHHTRSPTTASFAPSVSATLSGGSTIIDRNKMGALDGLVEVEALTEMDGPYRGSRIPFDRTVPAKHDYRTLVLCFDGTGDQFDSDNSNVVELFAALKKDDPDKQLVYYQAGIGTYTTPAVATPLMAKLSKTLDEMVAWNLDAHIMGGYEFLMQNYRANDKICIFGFSRGAYTARCLAGMVHKVGLLPTCNHQQVPFAYKMYTRMDDLGWKQSNAFKNAFSINVGIDFLGVWDTVSSVGIIPRKLPFTTSNTCVRVFRHAISLDERRAKFKENGWHRPDPKDALRAETDRADHEHLTGPYHNHKLDKLDHDSKKMAMAKQFDQEDSSHGQVLVETDVEEVWFAGCHCDIGGGSVSNGTRPNLARIPLRWMIRQLFINKTGIMFSARGLRKLGLDLDPRTLEPILIRPAALPLPADARIESIPRPVTLSLEARETKDRELAMAEVGLSEQELDLRDILSPVYDQLSLAKWWWILEFLPTKHSYQKSNNAWNSWLGINLGRGRHIPRQKKQGVKVHRTVKMRLDAMHENGSKYYPHANLNLDKVTWVD